MSPFQITIGAKAPQHERVARGGIGVHALGEDDQLARYTLATSGVLPLSFEELGARWEDLALETHDRYGWEPLRAAIGALYGFGPERVVTAAGTSGANHLA